MAAGYHFFDPSTMRGFRSRICPEVFEGKDGFYFVTSEQFEDSAGRRADRLYTVRLIRPDGSIRDLGEFQQHKTKRAALAAIRAHLAGVTAS